MNKHNTKQDRFKQLTRVSGAVLAVGLLGASTAALAECETGDPGCFGPAFHASGFSLDSSYLGAGHQATVNLYGGNLIVSATDVELPSIGGFGLFFRRTHNSNKRFFPLPKAPVDHDSPLGLGWTAHYGVLWPFPPTGGGRSPYIIHGDGSQEIFYQNNSLNGHLPTGDHISASLNILRRKSNTHYEMITPNGLIYTFTKQSHAYLVPTKVADVHGNTWSVSYRSENHYFQHPLIHAVSDDWGRTLRFDYKAVLGRLRLTKVSLGNQPLARFEYQEHQPRGCAVSQASQVFLFRHATPEGRTTTYESDQRCVPHLGAIVSITSPMGNPRSQPSSRKNTKYGYELVPFRSQSGAQGDCKAGTSKFDCAYAVTTQETTDGHSWEYQYGPYDPVREGEFDVVVTSKRGTSRESEAIHTFHTYGADFCDAKMNQVGRLKKLVERWNQERRERTYHYDRNITISRASALGNCLFPVTRPLLTNSTDSHRVDEQTYAGFDDLGFATRVTGPGAIARTTTFRHVTKSRVYVLGLVEESTVHRSSELISKTRNHYAGDSILPRSQAQYQDDRKTRVTEFAYSTDRGSRGALKTQKTGAYEETYRYQYGQLQEVVDPGGTKLVRTVLPSGLVQSEVDEGIHRAFAWDRDFRLTQVSFPRSSEEDVVIAYGYRSVTKTQGHRKMTVEYDPFGRIIRRSEVIDGRTTAIHETSSFDTFGRPRRARTPTGLGYTVTYDVMGQVATRSAPGDNNTYEYAYTPTGITVRTTHNGLTTEERQDHLGRTTAVTRAGRSVYFNHQSGKTTIRPYAQENHIFDRNLLGDLKEENHPESGKTTYAYTPEGWLSGQTGPDRTYRYHLDNLGRTTEIRSQGTLAKFRFHPTYRVPTHAEGYGSTFDNAPPVKVVTSDHDALGRPKRIETHIPRALDSPVIIYPFSVENFGARKAIRHPRVSRRSPLAFHWQEVPAAHEYDYEITHSKDGKCKEQKETIITASVTTPWFEIPEAEVGPPPRSPHRGSKFPKPKLAPRTPKPPTTRIPSSVGGYAPEPVKVKSAHSLRHRDSPSGTKKPDRSSPSAPAFPPGRPCPHSTSEEQPTTPSST